MIFGSVSRCAHCAVSQISFNPLLRTFSIMSKPSVYITRQLNDEAVNMIKEHCSVTMWSGPEPVPRDELLKQVKNKDGLLCLLTDKVDNGVLDTAGPSLKVVSTMSVGYDHLQVDEIKRRGIRIGYTPDILTDATAELTVALLLAASRRLFEANACARNGTWAAWSPFWMCGPSLSDSTVGIVGFGRIGQNVCRRLAAFNVRKFLYTSRTAKPPLPCVPNVEMTTFDNLLSQSDFVIVTCSLTPDTSRLFNANAFAKMKSNAVFVNTSRGGLVDQDALIHALKEKRIFAAGLDVMMPEPLPVDSELFKLDNCVILPHIGSATFDTRNNMAGMAARNLVCALKGESMLAEL